MVDRPRRFALGMAALLLSGAAHEGLHGKTVYRARDFFGVHRVTENTQGTAHMLVHGNTVHGMQWLEPSKRREALTYYHARGPIGGVFAYLQERDDRRPVAFIGMGAGSLATYGLTGQDFTFYEIDPLVIRIAQDERLFTFLRDSPAKVTIVPGDARLTLARGPARRYGLIVIDAFSSDAIPVHLLTREALAMYRTKLAEGGILAFHVSNRYLDLAPVLADLAGDSGMSCVTRSYSASIHDKNEGLWSSEWVLLADNKESLPPSALWQPMPARLGVRVWSDDYCNLIGALR